MGLLELLTKLSTYSKDDIQFCLLYLMSKGRIDFLDLNLAYTRYLEKLKEDKETALINAETCILESLMYDKFDNKLSSRNSIQKRLHILNTSKRFNMEEMNKELGYNQEYAKRLLLE